jgi:tetratricopeptide (TPR) repeat protein
VFYALALNATAAPTDKTYANQLKAGAILEKVLSEQPNHPGVAHYIIHSYDYPPLASRALAAARGYAKIAPSVPHAQHMPAHIFTRLGLWQESIDSNLASANAGKAYYARLGKETVWDQTLHALDYVVYAYLQTGQDQQARRVLEGLGAMGKAEPESFVAAYAFAAIPARVALEQRRWSEAAALAPAPRAFPWERFAWGEAITAFARAIGAARGGDAVSARAEVQKLESYRSALIATKQTYWAEQVDIQEQAAAAWTARAEGKNEEALKLMRAAADREDATEKHPVTPAPIVPARELLGELLLDLNQPAQALAEFEASAARDPNRLNGLSGAARAAEMSGDTTRAKALYARLVALCDRADTERPELRHAKAVLAK